MSIHSRKISVVVAALMLGSLGAFSTASAQMACKMSAAVENLPSVKITPMVLGDIADAFGIEPIPGTEGDMVPVPYLSAAAQGSIVMKITMGLENARASFDVGGMFAMDSNANLLEALGMKELADEQRKAKANLSSIEDPVERNAVMAEALANPDVGEALKNATKKLKELSQEQQDLLAKAHFSGFHAGGAIALIGQDIANIVLTLACIGERIGNEDASVIAEIAEAGLDAAVITQVWPSQIKALGASIKAFDKTAKANGKSMKKIYKKLKLKAPKMAAMKPMESSSAL
jgi:hypothetical protein